jgi:phosphate transport system protein
MKKPHLDHNFDDALAQLRSLVDVMASKAETTLADTLLALQRRDSEEAKRIMAADREMNGLEVEIDERCLRLLARWQPAASDLRFVATAFKLTVDLERIGDHCVNICERALELNHEEAQPGSIDVQALGATVSDQLHDALVALRSEDAQLASQIIERGRQTEGLVREALHQGLEALQRPGSRLGVAVRLHEIAGFLQRIAGHATNVAEMVIFLVRGEDVRHPGRISPPADVSGPTPG